jgi:hypothetical protein
MIRRKKPYILCPFYGEFWSTIVKTLITVWTSPPRRCAAARAKSTALGASREADAHASALGLVGGALEPTTIDAKLALSRPTHTSRHCCPPSSQGERSRFSTSLQFRRWKSHRKLRSGAPYTANSSEPPPWAGCATDRSAAPRPELLLAVRSEICSGD